MTNKTLPRSLNTYKIVAFRHGVYWLKETLYLFKHPFFILYPFRTSWDLSPVCAQHFILNGGWRVGIMRFCWQFEDPMELWGLVTSYLNAFHWIHIWKAHRRKYDQYHWFKMIIIKRYKVLLITLVCHSTVVGKHWPTVCCKANITILQA